MTELGSISERAKAVGVSDELIADAITTLANFALVACNGDASLAATICLSASAAIIDAFVTDYNPDEVADKARHVVLQHLEAHKADRPTIN